MLLNIKCDIRRNLVIQLNAETIWKMETAGERNRGQTRGKGRKRERKKETRETEKKNTEPCTCLGNARS